MRRGSRNSACARRGRAAEALGFSLRHLPPPADAHSVSQVSRPVQVALLVSLVFAALWFLTLRTHGGSEQPVAPLPQPAAVRDAPSASPAPVERSVTATAIAGAEQIGAILDPGASRAAPAPAREAAGAGELPGPVARAIAGHKVVVLLFWHERSPDDRAVRSTVARLDRRGGKVLVVTAPLRDLGRYAQITNGVRVLQSPTVVVVDGRRGARAITGFVDLDVIDQAVRDALAA